jgi:DMSO reductase family type II enzyme heme b subunit
MKRLVLVLIGCCIGSHAAFAQRAPAPDAAEWKAAAPMTVALNRTPPLYVTDDPATLEIPSVQMQVLRSATGTFIRLEWADKTHDTTALPKAERTWQGEHLVTQSEATGRFSDACALMISAKPLAGNLNPSLQMGDAAHPVRVYFWDSTRGPAILEATGRETTKRTGQVFPAQGQYAAGRWVVTMQLPDLPPGTPVAVAIWNGSQLDRDGRKYFSIWQPLR